MKIIVYCEPLLVPTSATPGRGMLKELITLRQKDEFILVVRSDYTKDAQLRELFETLDKNKNWSIYRQSPSRKITNFIGLFRFKNYCKLTPKGDVYLNMDCDYLGRHAQPLLITVADLSVLKGQTQSTFSQKLNYEVRKSVLKMGIRLAKHIIAISESTKTDILHFFPQRKESEITVIHNGIANEWFQVNKVSQQGQECYFIWWGFISARKNLEGLINGYSKAWEAVERKTNFPYLKIIYSNHSVPDGILDLVNRCAIANRIRFEKAMPLPRLIENVSASQGLIFPSLVEGFGVPVIEALACGIAVLASRIPALQEVGHSMINYCDPLSPESISLGILQISSTTYHHETAENRREYARRFTYTQAARDHSNLLDRVCIGA